MRRTERHLLALAIGVSAAVASLGCPSLGEIRVGALEGGTDAGHAERDVAVERVRDGGLPETSGDVRPDAVDCGSGLATDPKNCGRCGHDCRGGSCAAGVCQPYAIVTGNAGPVGVAVREGVVYFSSFDNTIEMCPADDCMNNLQYFAVAQQTPHGLTTDSTNVYWANEGFASPDGGFNGSIATCGLKGCPGGHPTLLAASEQGPMDVVVDPAAVFWSDVFGMRVRSCAIGGCGGAPTTIATDPAVLSGIAVDAVHVYWAEYKPGDIIQCPIAGCASFTPFATGQTGPQKLDVADGVLYWTTSDGVMSCPTTGCGAMGPTTFATSPNAYGIAHDAENLYWTTRQPAGQVYACALKGGATPTLLGQNQDDPMAVAVDAVSVYWTNSGGSTVMRVMK